MYMNKIAAALIRALWHVSLTNVTCDSDRLLESIVIYETSIRRL